MRLDTVTVELRPRSGWEAMELGSALVRRHARAVWLPWFAVTLPVFLAVLLSSYALGLLPLVPLVMWWLRPVFDRVPLFVLSRAVFGSVPTTGSTLRAQLRWGWRTMLGYLLWRRLSPMRAATLPVDLLEGAGGQAQRQRRSVLVSGIGGQTVLLTLICSNFILLMQVSLVLFAALLVIPSQFLPQLWQLLEGELRWGMPDWLLILVAVMDYLALCMIEPFYIGAGFGLYLNRRTELEAWDLEIAFRRMRQRLLGAAMLPLLALALGGGLLLSAAPDTAFAAQQAEGAVKSPAAAPASAADAQGDGEGDAESYPEGGDAVPPADKLAKAPAADPDGEDTADVATPPTPAATLDGLFGKDQVDHADFGKSVERAYANPDLSPKRTRTVWKPKDTPKKDDKNDDPFDTGALDWIGKVLGFIGEYGLWLLFGALVVLLALTARRWLPWLRLGLTRLEEEPLEIAQQPLPPPEALPPDVATVARRLWAAGQQRAALALLYRASVATMVARTGAVLPPGATESQCLRAARGLRDAEDLSLFQRMVRVWEYAAYGHRMPDGDAFERLVDQLSQQYGWAA